MIEKSRDLVQAGVAGKCSSPGSTFCADCILVSVPSCVTAVARQKISSILPKVQVAGYT